MCNNLKEVKIRIFTWNFGHIILICVARSHSNNSFNSTGIMAFLIHNLENTTADWLIFHPRYEIQISVIVTEHYGDFPVKHILV